MPLPKSAPVASFVAPPAGLAFHPAPQVVQTSHRADILPPVVAAKSAPAAPNAGVIFVDPVQGMNSHEFSFEITFDASHSTARMPSLAPSSPGRLRSYA